MLKVYAVIGGCNYEGEDVESLELFFLFGMAKAYEQELLQRNVYDYVYVEEREVL